LVSDPAEEKGIGLGEALGPVTMQLFIRGPGTMIAAPVQCDVDGIAKGSHCVLLKRPNEKKTARAARDKIYSARVWIGRSASSRRRSCKSKRLTGGEIERARSSNEKASSIG